MGKAVFVRDQKDKDDDNESKKETPEKEWSHLDKYIDLVLEGKGEDRSVFIYLNPNPNGNPYDLTVCSYQERHIRLYYTLGGKGLTLYEHDSPVEYLSLGQWLIERD